jgi:hypothetical protein
METWTTLLWIFFVQNALQLLNGIDWSGNHDGAEKLLKVMTNINNTKP